MVTALFLPAVGGVERYVLNLSRSLIALGWEVAVLTAELPGAPSHEILDGIEIFRTPTVVLAGGRFPLPKVWSAQARAQHERLMAWRPDVFIVHTHLFPSSLVGARLAARLHAPCVLIGHGSGYVKASNPLVDLGLRVYEHGLAWLLKPLCRKVWAVSGVAGQWWRRFGLRNDEVIYNGVDASRTAARDPAFRRGLGVPDEAPLVAFAARLLPDKGGDTLVRVFLRVAGDHPSAHLVIAGDGPASGSLKALAGDCDRIHFAGSISHQQVLALFAGADVMAYPSRYPEGLPTTVLEAGLVGCPVIATPMGGTAEAVRHGVDGLIAGTEAEFEAALRRLLSEPETRAAMGRSFQARVCSNFEWARIGEKVDAELRTLIRAST
jgi:glycosyltransferase involved in cell wall biosynthesis